MGGTMSAMFTALHPEYVKNLILLAAGIDFSTREGLINLWSDAKNFDVDAFVDDVGNCPADFLQSCFPMLSPVRNLLGKPVTLLERMDDAKFVEEFLTMEAWINDNVAVPGEVFRDFVKHLYQQNLLVKNQMQVGRQRGRSAADHLPGAEPVGDPGHARSAVAERAVYRTGRIGRHEDDRTGDGAHRPGDGLRRAARTVAPGRGLAGRTVVNQLTIIC